MSEEITQPLGADLVCEICGADLKERTETRVVKTLQRRGASGTISEVEREGWAITHKWECGHTLRRDPGARELTVEKECGNSYGVARHWRDKAHEYKRILQRNGIEIEDDDEWKPTE